MRAAVRSIRGFRISQAADPPSDPSGGCWEDSCVRVCTRGLPRPGVVGGRRHVQGRGHPSTAHSPRTCRRWAGGTLRALLTLLSSPPPPLPSVEGVCGEPRGETGGGGGDWLVWVGWKHGRPPTPNAGPAVPGNRPRGPQRGAHSLFPALCPLRQGAPIMLAPGPLPSTHSKPPLGWWYPTAPEPWGSSASLA